MSINMNLAGLYLTTRLVRSADVLTSQVDDNLMLLDVERDHYFGMNPVATHVWELLHNAPTVAEICASVAAHFDTDVEGCASDVFAFVGTLIDAGLARIVDESHGVA